ncbi:MAG: hypothetical protein LQ337_003518 [Flavoplaca oasis]|nr:MAG: hypothetical protein LQ337_003518 [Flavoplaca oasis]
MPPLSINVNNLVIGEMKTICEIDPNDRNRFLYGCSSPDWSKYSSYALADLPLLLNRPGPPFYAIGKGRADGHLEKVCKIDPHCSKNFLYETSGGAFASYPIADIPSLITSTGTPFFIPLKNVLPAHPIPGSEGCSFAHQGHPSFNSGVNHPAVHAKVSLGNETEQYGDNLTNLNRASIQEVERHNKLALAAWARNTLQFANSMSMSNCFPTLLANMNTSGSTVSSPVDKYQQALFSGASDESLAMRRQHWHQNTLVSKPDAYARPTGLPAYPWGELNGDMHGPSAPAPKGNLVWPSPNLLGCDPHYARKFDVPGHFSTSLPFSSPDIESPYFNCRHPLASAASSGSDIENNPPWNRYLQKYPKSLAGQKAIPDTPTANKGNKKPKCPFCTDLSILFSPNITKEGIKEMIHTHGCTYHRGLQDLAEGKPVSDQVHEQIWRMSGGARYDQLPEGERPFLHINQTGFMGRECYKWWMGRKSSAQNQMADRGHDVEKGREVVVEKDRKCDVEKGGHGDGKYRPRRCAGFTGKRLLSKKVKSMVVWIVVAIMVLGLWLDRTSGRDDVGGGVGGKVRGGLENVEWEGDEIFPQLDPSARHLEG